MEKQDRKLITELRNNSRISLTRLSKKLSLPVSTLFYRLKACEDSFIKKHTVLLDYKEIGFNARAHLAVSVGKEDKQRLRSALLKEPCVNSLSTIRDWDFYVELVFRQELDVDDFMYNLTHDFNILEYNLIHVIDDLKLESMKL